MDTIGIFVPTEAGAQLGRQVAPASILVGCVNGDLGRQVVDFEGHIYKPSTRLPDPDSAVARLCQATGRHLTKYPTVARKYVDPAAVLEVATWWFNGNLVELHRPELLDRWLAPLEVTADGFAQAVHLSEESRRTAAWAATEAAPSWGGSLR